MLQIIIPLAFGLALIGLFIWLVRIGYRWGFNAGYGVAHRKTHPEQLIPHDKHSSHLSVLRP
jgi:hypothetical protein